MKPIFVGGCDRSGTTLLAALLAGHRRAIAPPEAQFFLEGIAASRSADGDDPAAFAAFVRESWRFRLWELPAGLPGELATDRSRPAEIMAGLARAYADREGGEGVDRWIDHTPMNIAYAPTLFGEFEAAPMAHIVRDPRAVVASVLPLDWGPTSARAGARWWLSRIALGLAAESMFPGRVARIRYESLVRDPLGTLERAGPLLGLEFDPDTVGAGEARLPAYTHSQHALVGRAPDPSRIDAWKTRLSAAQIATIEAELGDMPAMLGYEVERVAPPIPGSSSGREFLANAVRTARQRWQHRARVRRALDRSTRPEQ